MENLWIYLVIFYGVLKGVRECMKKAALKKTGLMETLFFYMLIGFLFTLPDTASAISVEPIFIFWGFVKALVVSVGFILSFMAIERMPVGIYSVTTLSQMVFTTIFGVAFIGEPFGWSNLAGLVLVIAGLVMINLKGSEDNKKGLKYIAVFMTVGYCFLNSISATMDKVLTKYVTAAQLQFWFMFFSVIFYGVIILVRREKISIKTLRTNLWIPLMGFLLVLGDRCLFIANKIPDSKITIMTLLLQSSVVVSIILGRIFFKEKHIMYKLFCAAIVITGICLPLFF